MQGVREELTVIEVATGLLQDFAVIGRDGNQACLDTLALEEWTQLTVQVGNLGAILGSREFKVSNAVAQDVPRDVWGLHLKRRKRWIGGVRSVRIVHAVVRLGRCVGMMRVEQV